MRNIVIFGPPGSGKGTQCQLIVDSCAFVHISTGDLLRHEVEKQTILGLNAKSYMDRGELVPDRIIFGMIENKIDDSPCEGILFDGFPRNIKQAIRLDRILEKRGFRVDLVVSLEVSEQELYRRILERGKTSGRSMRSMRILSESVLLNMSIRPQKSLIFTQTQVIVF